MELIRSDLVKNALASDTVVALLKKTVPNMDKALLKVSRGWVNTGMQTTVLVETIGGYDLALYTGAGTACLAILALLTLARVRRG